MAPPHHSRKSRVFRRILIGLGTIVLIAGALILVLELTESKPAERDPEYEREPNAVTEAEAPEDGTQAAPPGAIDPEVLPFEGRITARLRETRPAAAPIPGPLRFEIQDIQWLAPEGADLSADRLIGFVEPYTRGRMIFRDVDVAGGRIEIRPAGATGPYVIRGIEGVIAATVFDIDGDADPRIRVAEAAGALVVPEREEPVAVAVADLNLRFPEGEILFAFDRGTIFGGRIVDAEGVLRPGAPGLGLEATARVASLPLAGLRGLAPALPAQGTAAFMVRIEPLTGTRTAVRIRELALVSGESEVRGAVTFILDGMEDIQLASLDLQFDPLELALLQNFTGSLPYEGVIIGGITGGPDDLRFDVRAQLTDEAAGMPVVARITGRARIGPEGFEIRALTAEFDRLPLGLLGPLATWLPPDAVVSGRITMSGAPGTAPLQVDLVVELATGRILVQGRIDISGPIPAYDLAGRTVGVPLSALAPALPPAGLSGRFTIEGRGTEPGRIDARLTLTGEFDGWRTRPGDGVRIRAQVDEGLLALEIATVELGPVQLAASGAWHFRVPASGGIAYELTIESLDALVPFTSNAELAGAFATEGRIQGTIETPRFVGTFAAEDFRYDGWHAESARGEYAYSPADLRGTRLLAVAEGLTTPTGGTYQTARAHVQIGDPELEVVLAATQDGERAFVFAADGRLTHQTAGIATIRQLRFNLDGSTWALADDARIRWREGWGIAIRELVVEQVEGTGILAVNGHVPPDPGERLRFRAAALPVGEVMTLAGLGPDPWLTGLVWTEGTLTGTLEEPRIALDFRVLDARIGDSELARVAGEIRYRNSRLRLEAQAAADTTAAEGTFRMQAVLPARLSLAGTPQFQIVEGARLEGEFEADSFPVSAFQPLIFRLRDIRGVVDGQVRIGGTPAQPRFAGTLVLRHGEATVALLRQRYTEIAAVVRFEGGRAIVDTLRARSDGWARGSGVIQFAELARPVFDLTLSFERFRPVAVEDRNDAAVWGELHLAGPVSGPILSGNLRVNDGALPIPTLSEDDPFTPLLEDEEILAAAQPMDNGDNGWVDALTVDALTLHAGNDLWFVAERTSLRLGGDLTLLGTAGEFRILGVLRGSEGVLTLVVGPVVRRLDVIEAQVRFLGTGEIEPVISVLASQTVFGPNGQPFNILVSIGGSIDAPTVTLATEQESAIPQSTLLSFVLFGRPGFAAGPGIGPGAAVLEDVLLGGIVDLAALELEEAILGGLGLPGAYLRIQPGLFGEGPATLVFGTEITDEVFLTIDTGIGSIFGEDNRAGRFGTSLRWRIQPDLTLELGLEPVFPVQFFPTVGFISPILKPEQQFTVDLRKRWTYD